MKQEIIISPNYSFADSYLTELIHKVLMNAQKILILAPIPNSNVVNADKELIDHTYYLRLRDYLSNTILKGKFIYSAKSIQILKSDDSSLFKLSCNIAITSAYDLLNNAIILESNRNWFKNLGLIIYENVTDFLSFNRFWQGLLSNLLYDFTNDCHTIYLASDRVKLEDGIKSEFRTGHNVEERTFNENNKSIPFLYFVSWNRENEGSSLQNLWLNTTADYAGMEDIIIHKAIDDKIDSAYFRVNFSTHIPYEDYAEAIQRQDNSFGDTRYLDYIQFQKNKDSRFIASDDIYNNISYLIYRHRTPNAERIFLNIASTPYLFKDYMLSNLAYFNDYTLLPLSPLIEQNDNKRRLVILFEMLRRYPLDANFISNYLSLHLKDTTTLRAQLCNLYEKEFGSTAINDYIIETLSQAPYSSWKKISKFNIKAPADFVLDSKTALMKITDNEFKTVVYDTIPKDIVTQFFLSKRHFVYAEKMFKLSSIDFEHNTVEIKKDTVFSQQEFFYTSKVINKISVKAIDTNGRSYKEIADNKTETINNKLILSVTKPRLSEIIVSFDKRYDFSEQYDYQRANIIKSQSYDIDSPFIKEHEEDNPLHRVYKDETCLLVSLKATDKQVYNFEDTTEVGKISATLCYLFKEAMVTFLPDSYMCLDIVCLNNFETEEKHIPFSSAEFDINLTDPTAINLLIIEDAIQDMGLLRSIEENIHTIFYYLDDYLQWYLSQSEDIEVRTPNSETYSPVSENDIELSPEESEGKGQKSSKIPFEITEVSIGYDGQMREKVPKKVRTDVLKMIGGKHPDFFDLENTKSLISAVGKDNNEKTTKRIEYLKRKELIIQGGEATSNDKNDKHQCDFCGATAAKEEMLIIKDGRERCPDCSNQQPWDKFEDIETNIIMHVDKFFASVNQKKPTKKLEGYVTYTDVFNNNFQPSQYMDSRALGLATFMRNQNGKEEYKIYVENGMPNQHSILTTIHEWVHIWQYQHLDLNKMQDDYDKLLIEGHTTWCEVYYASKVAKWKHESPMYWENFYAPLSRKDEYGDGYRLIKGLLSEHNAEEPFSLLLKMYPKDGKTSIFRTVQSLLRL